MRVKNFITCIKFILLLAIIVLILTQSPLMFEGILQGIEISMNTLTPSLYGFMIFSSLIVSSELQKIIAFPFAWVSTTLFKLERELFCIYLLSLLGGYPIGAKLIAQKIKAGEISSATGEYMLNFCINCSPAFLITGIGAFFWGNIKLGVTLYISQFLASVIIGISLAFTQKQVHRINTEHSSKSLNFSTVLVSSVNSSTKAMLTICSFVIAFWAFFPFLDYIPLPEKILFTVKGFVEVTYGCYEIRNYSFFSEILMICAFTAFGGICVIFQIVALLSGCKVKLRSLIISRIANTILSVGICYVALKFFPQVLQAFSFNEHFIVRSYSTSPIASIFMILLGILLLSFSKKYDKI